MICSVIGPDRAGRASGGGAGSAGRGGPPPESGSEPVLLATLLRAGGQNLSLHNLRGAVRAAVWPRRPVLQTRLTLHVVPVDSRPDAPAGRPHRRRDVCLLPARLEALLAIPGMCVADRSEELRRTAGVRRLRSAATYARDNGGTRFPCGRPTAPGTAAPHGQPATQRHPVVGPLVTTRTRAPAASPPLGPRRASPPRT
jgi:hypothetical protein